MEPVRIGLIGCGTISPAYLRAAATFDILRFVGCADIDAAAATTERDELAAEYARASFEDQAGLKDRVDTAQARVDVSSRA